MTWCSMTRRTFIGATVFALSLVSSVGPAAAIDDHLLLCEAVVTPTASEFIEIANPTGSAIDLTDYYLSDDEDYALLPGFFGTGPAPSISSSDFIARFPNGTSIPAGGVLTIAFDGAGFATAYGFAADFEIAGTDGTPDMLEAFTGSIGATAGLTNSGENAVLFTWNGTADLVSDVDMTNIGTPSTGNDIGDKTGVSVDGPDGDTTASTYATDAWTMLQQSGDPGSGTSTKRILLETGQETSGPGNGLTGDDETTEQITVTWDSTFTAPDPGTCGALSPMTPMLVINEIDYDQDSTDTAEFIEIKNTGSISVDLDAYQLVLVNGSGGSIYNTIDLPSVSLAPGDYYVVCGDAANVANCDLDVSPDTNLIQNGPPDAVGLELATAPPPGPITPRGTPTLIDAVSYEGDTTGYTEGSGSGLEDSPSIDLASISRFPDGADTDMNNVDLSQRCATPGEANSADTSDCVPPPVAELVINEIDYDQPSTDFAEFIEIKNIGVAAVDLNPYELVLVNGSTGSPYDTINLPSFSLPAGDFYVVCADTAETPNCDLEAISSIQNGAPDAVALELNAAPPPGPITSRGGGTIVDTVSYEGDTTGYTEGSGAGLEDPGSTGFDNIGISRFPDGADTDMNNVDLSTRCATPGLPNIADTSSCELPEPPMLVINEIDYDQDGTDAAEFVEIKNVGSGAADLTGVDLIFVNGSGGSTYDTISLPSVMLAAGDYFVVCANAGTVLNCDLDDGPDTNFIQNGAPDAVALLFAGTTLDAVSYEGDTAGFTEGSGAGLEDDSGFDFRGISRFPDGVDTDMNNVDLSPRCISPGEPNLSTDTSCQQPVRSAIVINEIDYDQPSSDTAEFIELKNITGDTVGLDPYTLELVNGSGGGAVVYQTIDLPAVGLPGGDYYVICADALTVPNCDLEVISSIQNGAPDAAGLMLGGEVVEAVSYEGDTAGYTEGSGTGLEDPGSSGDDNLGISRFPDGIDTEMNNVDLSTRCITPGAPNTSVADDCLITGPASEIHDIQGSGLTSPFETTVVNTTDNIVTAVASNGFFIQTPDARIDGDVETSQGIFVFTGVAPSVAQGDQVDVRGEIVEFFDFTEFGESPLVIIDSSGNALPSVVTFDEFTPSPDQPQPDTELERFEGMLVSFDGIATGPTDRFGDTAVVAKDERAFRETGIEFPGLGGLPIWDGNPEIFEVDADGAGLPDDPIFATQEVTAEGPLGFSFGDYQVLPTSLTLGVEPTFPVAVRSRMPGEFTIATQNVERLCDPDPADCSPVPDAAEYALRLEKFSRQIREVLGSPDIVAIQEVEDADVLEDLAARILADDATVDYSAWSLPGNDVGGINVGYLTRDDTISVNFIDQFGEALLLSFDGSLLYDRPPLILDADYIGGSDPFPITVINVHQRSLSGIDDPTDGERVRTKRFEQAFELSVFIQSIQDTEPGDHIVVTGDFNAFQFTDGYVDVMGQLTGELDPLGALVPGTDELDPNLENRVLSLAPEERYSFIFGGSAQVLDHMLTNVTLEPYVTGIQYGRGNADAPDSLGDDPSTPLRSADHDGLVLFIDSDPDFLLTGPAEPVAPGENVFDIIGGTANGRLRLAAGRQMMTSMRSIDACGVMIFDIGPRANNFGFTDADPKGAGTIAVCPPANFAGETAYFQAIDVATCTLSNVVEVTFEMAEESASGKLAPKGCL